MTRVYLIRHGTTENNLKGVFQGSQDIPLGPQGKEQAVYLARRFRNIWLDAVYTSPLSRASETAKAICRYHPELSLVECAGLREICGGDLEGRTGPENAALYPDVMRCMKERPAFFHPPGGESAREVYDRMRETMQMIVAQNPGHTVAVISHGFTIQAYLGFVKGVPFKALEPYIVGNASVTALVYTESGSIQLEQQSDESHLPSGLSFYVAADFL